MRHVGNFNPEWGYLAPAPSLLRTARVFLVAAAIGGTTSAAVVFSLMDQPAAETTVAARTLVLSAEPSLSAPATKLMAQQPAQSARSSVSPTPGAEASGPHGAAGAAHATAGSAAASEPSAAPTTPSAPVAAPLAEAPRVTMTDAPPAQALAPEGNAVLAAQAGPAAVPAPALKGAAKKARAAARAAVAPRYDVPRYAAPRYEAMQRGPYAFLRQFGTFGQPY
jgi:hypothetical protein